MNWKITAGTLLCLACMTISSCGSKGEKDKDADETVAVVNADGIPVDGEEQATVEGLPYSPDSIREQVVIDYGNRTVRTVPDKSLSFANLVKNKAALFIVMSKKDYYLYVYEPQGSDTVLIARYDCAFALRKGQKETSGDMRTPHCTMSAPFVVQQIAPASEWSHDFGDGRGSIKSYGDYFLRLKTPGHNGIGIHGSTNNRESVPGRASEGCIRLKDEDIKELAENFVTVGMKVVIKAEEVDDYPFEIHAMKRQKIARKRHFDPSKTLTNAQIATADAVTDRVATASKPVEEANPALKDAPSGKQGVRIAGGEIPNPEMQKAFEGR